MTTHYINILEKIIDNPNVAIKDIDILSAEEKNKLLYDFNHTAVPYSKDKTVSQLFEEQVEKTPDSIAVVFGEQQLTYRELNEKANSLANYMKCFSVTSGTVVGILLNRSIEIVISMLATLKLGAAYLPLDPTYPESRIDYILKDSNVNLILTSQNLTNKFSSQINYINTSMSNNEIYLKTSSKNPEANFSSDALAYLIYTSGSTGKPKGVTISNKNIINFCTGIAIQTPIQKFKNIVSITTICFDIFVLETLFPLLYGMTIIMANEEEQVNPKCLNTLCLKNNVNILQTTPSKFSLLLSDKNNLEYVKNLKYILINQIL